MKTQGDCLLKILFLLVELAAQQYWRSVITFWATAHPTVDPRIRLVDFKFDVFSDDWNKLVDPTQVGKDTTDVDLTCGDGWKPDLVIVSCGGYEIEARYINAAKAAGIPSVACIDTWYGYRRRFTFREQAVYPDRILVIDDKMIEEAVSEGLPADIMEPAGQPSWEAIKILCPIRSRDILFLDAPVQRDYGNELGYSEKDCWTIMMTAQTRAPDLFGNIFVSPHPDGQSRQNKEEATTVPYYPAILERIGTVIGMFSAPLIHAYLAKRRVISLQPGSAKTDMCPLSRHHRIRRALSVEDLIQQMTAPPNDPHDLANSLVESSARVTTVITSMVKS